MRKYRGFFITVLIWIAVTLAMSAWFGVRVELERIDLIVSGVYMVFLLALIPAGLPLHSRLLEVLLMLYGLVLGVLDVATFLGMKHPVVNVLSPILMGPYTGVFYVNQADAFGLSEFATRAIIGIFAAFLCIAAGVGACMVQPREWDA